MRLADMAERSFARHETFHPRYGWFRKAYAFVADEGNDFNQEDAPIIIGVGKNMVRAIRFWGLAAKLIVRGQQSRKPRTPSLVPTRRGRALFGEKGWDPYMAASIDKANMHHSMATKTSLPMQLHRLVEHFAVECAHRKEIGRVVMDRTPQVSGTPERTGSLFFATVENPAPQRRAVRVTSSPGTKHSAKPSLHRGCAGATQHRSGSSDHLRQMRHFNFV